MLEVFGIISIILFIASVFIFVLLVCRLCRLKNRKISHSNFNPSNSDPSDTLPQYIDYLNSKYCDEYYDDSYYDPYDDLDERSPDSIHEIATQQYIVDLFEPANTRPIIMPDISKRDRRISIMSLILGIVSLILSIVFYVFR